MGLEQMYALSGGGRYKSPYVSEINARTPYLPALYQQKKSDEYQDKMYAIEQQKIGLNQEMLDEEKKRNKLAKNLGYANIGLGAGLGVLGNWDTISSGAKSMWDTLSPDTWIPEVTEAFSGGSASPIPAPIDLASGGFGEYVSPILKELGGAWDWGTGLFDGLVGDSIDIDWDWSDAFSI